ncbi:MAG: FkbM family methyltransferase [Holosporaceae bacterium]|jgi:FkbM family methyltransferase|nr:FkbM family methyltransferase [Holosporaceae bacterium]
MFHEYASKRIDTLKKDTDERSQEVLDFVLLCMESDFTKRYYLANSSPVSLPNYMLEHKEKWLSEKAILNNQYVLPQEKWIASEVFYFHHNLRFANQKIRDYVQHKDIIDCGAFDGDSLLVLRNYTDKTVFCYEFSPENAKKFQKLMDANNIHSGYELINKALGDESKLIKCPICSGECCRIFATNDKNTITVEMTSIDEEVKNHKANVGFIKMDVEGAGFSIIKGAINTIKAQRPVLSLAVYHNNQELFGIKPFLEEHLTDYVYEFHLNQFHTPDFSELILFCYPKELAM